MKNTKRRKPSLVSLPGGKLTEKQRRFVERYMGEAKGNATEAARLAGYSPKTAQEQASRLLSNVIIQRAIADRIAPEIADRARLQQFWTSVFIDESQAMRDRLKASELLARTHGAFIETTGEYLRRRAAEMTPEERERLLGQAGYRKVDDTNEPDDRSMDHGSDDKGGFGS